MKLKSKLFASAVAFTMVLSMVAVPVSAQTTAELTAQINALLAQIAQLQAQISGGAVAQGSAVQFNSDLTVGSTGADVTALQQFLVGKGYLQMPANVSYGYFGPITKAAVAAYQTAAGITPAVGYFGPITRAKVNAMGGTTTGGTTTGGTTTGTIGITTPGVEGTLSVTSNNSGLVSTVYEGDEMVSVLGFNAEAKTSDIAIQRVKLDLGTDSKIYNKGYDKMYLTDSSGNVLVSVDLNSSTVVKEANSNGVNHYYVTFSGFNYVVAKDAKKQLIVKADVMSSIENTDRDILSSIAIAVATNGVRGIDGAGIDEYADGSVSRSVTFSAELSDTAALKVSLNGSSPDVSSFVASDGSDDNELDKVTVLVFDAKAEKDDANITDITLTVSTLTGAAKFPTYYLYDGSTEIDSASANAIGTSVVFSDLDLMVSKDTTKTFTVKVDVRSAQVAKSDITVSLATANVDFENSVGDTKDSSGSAAGRAISFTKSGGQVNLVSKSVTTNGAPQGTNSNNYSTSTLTATFNVKVKASGSDLVIGTSASTSPLFATTTNFMKVYKNGTALADNTWNSAVSYTIPNTCVVSGNSCTLSDGNEITIPVTFIIYGRSAAGAGLDAGLYSVGLEGLQLNSGNVTFMAGLTDWRTAEVSFP